MSKNLPTLLADFKAAKEAHEKTLKAMPRIMGTIAVKNIKRNFSWQAYNDGVSFRSWKGRKSATNIAYTVNRGKGGNSRYKGTVFNAANPLLQQTRRLYNSIAYKTLNGGVFIGVDLGKVPYARAHNEGLTIRVPERKKVVHFRNISARDTLKGRAKVLISSVEKAHFAQKVGVGAHTIKEPKRQFMPLPGEGANKGMQDEIKEKFDTETAKNFKSFKN